jgi:hypothetical protein
MPLSSTRIDAPRAVAAGRHEAGAFEHAQVLGDRRAGHVEPCREAPDGLRALAQLLEHGPAGRVGEGLDRSCVSHA